MKYVLICGNQSDMLVSEYWLATESLERSVDYASVQKQCSLCLS